MHYVYLLKLSDDAYYAGQTADLDHRLKNHRAGKVKTTAKYQSIELVWYGAFSDKTTAVRFEKYLKTSSGKAFRNSRLI